MHLDYEVEVYDRAGRHRPKLWPKMLQVFPEAFRQAATQGETCRVMRGLDMYVIKPVGAPPTIHERLVQEAQEAYERGMRD